jgi:hypothetical protein
LNLGLSKQIWRDQWNDDQKSQNNHETDEKQSARELEDHWEEFLDPEEELEEMKQIAPAEEEPDSNRFIPGVPDIGDTENGHKNT